MTSNERAYEIVDKCRQGIGLWTGDLVRLIASAIDDATKAAIEEEREAIAGILKKEAEYHRGMESAGSGWESRTYHQVAAKTAEHLEREIRARSSAT
jgi:hypothetical protein